MGARTRTFSAIAHSVAMAIAMGVAIPACQAADQSIPFTETGRPRELVNRANRWTCENVDGLRRCETPDR